MDGNFHSYVEKDTTPAVFSAPASIVAQRNLIIADYTAALSHFEEGFTKSKSAFAKVQLLTAPSDLDKRSQYRESVTDELHSIRFDKEDFQKSFRQSVDRALWKFLMEESGMTAYMDTKAKQDFRNQLSTDAPEITEDTIRATFENLFENRETIFLRGVANVFSALDQRFKSHDVFKVKSRVIISGFYSFSGFSRYSSVADKINDVERVLRQLLGLPPNDSHIVTLLDEQQGSHYGPRQLMVDVGYMKIRSYMNGNAHLYFSALAANHINRALAKYYGAVMPDAAEEHEAPEGFQLRVSGLPTKDFAFYPTPPEAADKLVSGARYHSGMRVLEPQAGQGALIKALDRYLEAGKTGYNREYYPAKHDVFLDAIEVHPTRAAELRDMSRPNMRVTCANFLSTEPNPIYDLVISNPPFSGKEWMKHAYHAFLFLKPGGNLRIILPINAKIADDKQTAAFHRWLDKEAAYYSFNDLPSGSFAASGTNINTVILDIKKSSR